MKIFVLFVEPMLYIMDLIRDVYDKTPHDYKYVFCASGITGRDSIALPDNAEICTGSSADHVKQIKERLSEWEPDLVIINGYSGREQTAAIIYCKRHHIPYAIESDTPLHIPSNSAAALAKKIWLRYLLHNRYCYGFPGGTPQKENLIYYGIPEERNHIMPMSVSPDRLLKAWNNADDRESIRKKLGINDKSVFLYVGRLEPVKNTGLLIEAYREVNESYTETALLIVGDGSEVNKLRNQAERIPDVIFTGYRAFPNLIDYYKAADVFVLPSRFEPWGLVVNEAMTFGLPVIVSSAAGCHSDLVVDAETGFVFENDNAGSLVDKMINVLSIDTDRMKDNIKRTIEFWNHDLYLASFTKGVEDIVSVKTI